MHPGRGSDAEVAAMRAGRAAREHGHGERVPDLGPRPPLRARGAAGHAPGGVRLHGRRRRPGARSARGKEAVVVGRAVEAPQELLQRRPRPRQQRPQLHVLHQPPPRGPGLAGGPALRQRPREGAGLGQAPQRQHPVLRGLGAHVVARRAHPEHLVRPGLPGVLLRGLLHGMARGGGRLRGRRVLRPGGAGPRGGRQPARPRHRPGEEGQQAAGAPRLRRRPHLARVGALRGHVRRAVRPPLQAELRRHLAALPGQPARGPGVRGARRGRRGGGEAGRAGAVVGRPVHVHPGERLADRDPARPDVAPLPGARPGRGRGTEALQDRRR
mmetsp:Transcript_66511/g.187346  ORF Transcript_66511/g.187346 Transcript_66511/m.187346 type:complete len:327 (+) Transcript_66511:99-1079(+)